MALALAPHDQRGVHVHVVAGQVQADQALEEHAVRRLGRREEDEQARGGAAVRDHVEHGAEPRRLVEPARRDAIGGVQQAGDAVQEATAAGVERHEVEGGDGQDDAAVACRESSASITAPEGGGLERAIPIRFGTKRKMFSSVSGSGACCDAAGALVVPLTGDSVEIGGPSCAALLDAARVFMVGRVVGSGGLSRRLESPPPSPKPLRKQSGDASDVLPCQSRSSRGVAENPGSNRGCLRM